MSLSIGIGSLRIGSHRPSGTVPVVPEIPVFVSAEINNDAPLRIVLTFDIPLEEEGTGTDRSAFVILINGVELPENGIDGCLPLGNTYFIDLWHVVIDYGDIVTVSYTKPALNPLKGLTGGEVASFSESVVNNIEYIYLIDTYTGSSVSLSLRKLKSDYTGYCIQVSNGTTTQDIGFVNNLLDTVSLLAFAGTSTLGISKWYDQSGNGRDATQTTFALMPKIVIGGVLEIYGTQPVIYFNGSNYLNAVDHALTTFTIFATAFATDTLNNTIYCRGTTTANNYSRDVLFFVNFTGKKSVCQRSNNVSYPTAEKAITPNTLNVLSCVFTGTTLTDRANGIDGTPVATTIGGTTSNPKSVIGAAAENNSIVTQFRGLIGELIVYDSDQSVSIVGIETNINLHLASSDLYSGRSFASTARYGENPIIPHGIYDWNNHGADTPYINYEHKIGNTWYALTQATANFYEWFNIVLYTSTDLSEWTAHITNPVISSTQGSWDDHEILHPSVIKVGEEWWCYYSGVNAANKRQIGLAKSTDYITWVKYGNTPVYSQTGDVCVPSVIKIGSLYVMYYWNNLISTNSKLLYATSIDGLTWTYGGVVVNNGTTILDPFVIKNRLGVYEMVFTQYISNQCLTYAYSYDGICWQYNGAIILNKYGSSWEEQSLGDPVLLEKDDGTAYLYYVGMSAGAEPHSDGGMAML